MAKTPANERQNGYVQQLKGLTSKPPEFNLGANIPQADSLLQSVILYNFSQRCNTYLRKIIFLC